MLTKLTKPAPHPPRRMPQYTLSALSIRKVIVCAKSLSRTGQFLKRQTPPVVYTRIKLLSATAATKGFGTSLSTPKFPLHPWQVNKVNPPHIVIGNSAYTVAVSTRQALSPHTHFNEVLAPKHKSAAKAATWYTASNATFVANNMLEKPNALSMKGFANTSGIYGRVSPKNLWDDISTMLITAMIHHR